MEEFLEENISRIFNIQANLVDFLNNHDINTRRDFSRLDIDQFLINIDIDRVRSEIENWFMDTIFSSYKKDWFHDQEIDWDLDLEIFIEDYGFDPDSDEGREAIQELNIDLDHWNYWDFRSIAKYLDIWYCRRCFRYINYEDEESYSQEASEELGMKFCTECYERLEREFTNHMDNIPLENKLKMVLNVWKESSTQTTLHHFIHP